MSCALRGCCCRCNAWQLAGAVGRPPDDRHERQGHLHEIAKQRTSSASSGSASVVVHLVAGSSTVARLVIARAAQYFNQVKGPNWTPPGPDGVRWKNPPTVQPDRRGRLHNQCGQWARSPRRGLLGLNMPRLGATTVRCWFSALLQWHVGARGCGRAGSSRTARARDLLRLTPRARSMFASASSGAGTVAKEVRVA